MPGEAPEGRPISLGEGAGMASPFSYVSFDSALSGPPLVAGGFELPATTIGTTNGTEAIVGGGPLNGFVSGDAATEGTVPGAPQSLGAGAEAPPSATPGGGPETQGAGAKVDANAGAPKLGDNGTTTPGQDKAKELTESKLTFSADKSQAHLFIDKEGNFSPNKDKPLAKGQEAVAHVDPSLKDIKKIEAAIDKANEKLAESGIKLRKPDNLADALKTVQDQQAKVAEKEKAAGKKNEDPSKPGAKKPVPDGGGGGGGGGGAPPNKRQHEGDKPGGNKNTTKTDASGVPKSFKDSSDFLSEKGGLNHGSYGDYMHAVYDNIPGFSGAGGLMSQFADIDNDPNMTPEQKAAAKAKLMAEFQEKNKDKIKANSEKYAKESGEFGDKDSAAGFESMAKNLADPSKAGDIVNLLSKSDKISKATEGKSAEEKGVAFKVGLTSTDISNVFDSSAQKALGNLALIEAKGVDWKSTAKERSAKEAEATAEGKVVAEIIANPFSFRRK